MPSSVLAAAVTATSTAPNSTPTAIRTITSVRIAGVRSEPSRGRRSAAAGRQRREAGCAANAAVAASRTTPPTRERRAGATRARRCRARAAGRRSRSARRRTPRGRRRRGPRRDRGGGPEAARAGRRRPAGWPARSPIASATRTASGAPAGSTAIATSSAAATLALASSTEVWPRRSTSWPSSGPPTPSASAVDAGDDAGGGERAGQVLRVDQQADAEHRQRQPREDREWRTGGVRRGMRRSSACADARFQLVQLEDPDSWPWTRPVSRSSCSSP